MNFEIINGDVRLKRQSATMANADVVIPLAAIVGAPLCAKDPVAAKTTNHDQLHWMLDIASKEQLILMPTTNSAYGSGTKTIFVQRTLNPISSYISKVEVEKKLMEENSISFVRSVLACLQECELIRVTDFNTEL